MSLSAFPECRRLLTGRNSRCREHGAIKGACLPPLEPVPSVTVWERFGSWERGHLLLPFPCSSLTQGVPRRSCAGIPSTHTLQVINSAEIKSGNCCSRDNFPSRFFFLAAADQHRHLSRRQSLSFLVLAFALRCIAPQFYFSRAARYALNRAPCRDARIVSTWSGRRCSRVSRYIYFLLLFSFRVSATSAHYKRGEKANIVAVSTLVLLIGGPSTVRRNYAALPI